MRGFAQTNQLLWVSFIEFALFIHVMLIVGIFICTTTLPNPCLILFLNLQYKQKGSGEGFDKIGSWKYRRPGINDFTVAVIGKSRSWWNGDACSGSNVTAKYSSLIGNGNRKPLLVYVWCSKNGPSCGCGSGTTIASRPQPRCATP